jgi:hypothetical protein
VRTKLLPRDTLNSFSILEQAPVIISGYLLSLTASAYSVKLHGICSAYRALMSEILESSAAKSSQSHTSFFGFLFFLLILFSPAACGIKHTVHVPVPTNVQQDKTASLEDLLRIIGNYEKIQSLVSNSMRVTLVTGMRETGVLQEYSRAPGYILLSRPDSTHMVVQNPLTKSTVVDMLSIGNDFSAWIPSENKFYKGKNDAKEFVAEDSPGKPGFTIPIRAAHIFEAVFPQGMNLNSPGTWVSMEEAAGPQSRYYVLTILRTGTAPRIHIIRKTWIERIGLTIARQQTYTGEGRIVSDVDYSNYAQFDGFPLPQKVHIDRPIDGYSLNMEFKSWRVNPSDLENGFALSPPQGAHIIPLREKGKSTSN